MPARQLSLDDETTGDAATDTGHHSRVESRRTLFRISGGKHLPVHALDVEPGGEPFPVLVAHRLAELDEECSNLPLCFRLRIGRLLGARGAGKQQETDDGDAGHHEVSSLRNSLTDFTKPGISGCVGSSRRALSTERAASCVRPARSRVSA